MYATSTIDHLARFGEVYERSGMYMTDQRPTGAGDHELAVKLTLDGACLDRKVAALAAMASQTRAAMSAYDQEIFAASVAEESFVDAVRVPGRSTGSRWDRRPRSGDSP